MHSFQRSTFVSLKDSFAMKKIHILLAGVIMASIVSCNSASTSNAEAAETPVSRRTIESEVNKTVASLTISGMTCAEGCGGKIQKDLQALNGVVTTDLQFEENKPQNTVLVTFDPGLITEKEMIGCVNGIADGAYHVDAVEIIEYKGLQSSGGSGVEGSLTFTEFGRLYQLLNLLQTVSKLAQ
jgi:copper chaperone CopZ